MPFISRNEFIRQLWMLDCDYAGDTFTAQLWERGRVTIAVPKVLEWLDAAWVEEQLARIERRKRARAA